MDSSVNARMLPCGFLHWSANVTQNILERRSLYRQPTGLLHRLVESSSQHGGEVCASGVWGLMAPQSPEKDRRLTWWYYSQGAPGVFKGDLYFYSVGHALRGKLHLIDTNKCPVYLMTGEFDYFSTPEDSKRTADQIPGAKFVEMKGIGHFPMSENHEVFVKYLKEILNEILSYNKVAQVQ
ncbi:alpha/beta hydrolase [Aneurinibacillus sp. Ricciae_BoGa-3]|uniref:alpha/beta fold hydrolase n=1 Tax=Aneurinibacillus sp. Ricciae_BoGa-3 TaxID=3022697 RepID=UPI0023403A07|nr:alpha/beta hydrolase [Aneurinibacillus sp. Ricciae_BoGa-3]WCK54549.1 alpha/beta hydrolase [Aneurinibacillus sp. Ricciae_BoGa-3]